MKIWKVATLVAAASLLGSACSAGALAPAPDPLAQTTFVGGCQVIQADAGQVPGRYCIKRNQYGTWDYSLVTDPTHVLFTQWYLAGERSFDTRHWTETGLSTRAPRGEAGPVRLLWTYSNGETSWIDPEVYDSGLVSKAHDGRLTRPAAEEARRQVKRTVELHHTEVDAAAELYNSHRADPNQIWATPRS